MKILTKPFNLKNSLGQPKVTKDYLRNIGIEESRIVYVKGQDSPLKLFPINDIFYQNFDCVIPTTSKYLLVRKGRYCGVVNGYLGTLIIEPVYMTIIPPINCDNFAVQNKKEEWGVLKAGEPEPIIAFGKYSYIWGFDNDLCLVASPTKDNLTFSNRGIININGKEVIKPYSYTDIYNFYGKNVQSITVENGDQTILLSREEFDK